MDIQPMKSIIAVVEEMRQDFIRALPQATTTQALQVLSSDFLSRNGRIAHLMSLLKQLSLEEKRQAGPALSDLKQFIESSLITQQEAITQQEQALLQKQQTSFDVTAYKTPTHSGSLHIYTKIIERLENIFISMGYTIVSGPEVETEFYNFDALNIPKDHPARDSHDTFWLTLPGMLLRTHTSAVQIRTLEQEELPLAICSVGRVFRNEATDASHNFMFTQIEGLFIDKDVSMTHLLATVQTFLQQVFENKNLSIRARSSYFPFVEPGIEIDCSCPFCSSGCSVCKKTGWIELMGAGLVHPNVLTSCGIDPTIYSGFAFGMGLDRLAMIQYGIYDIRLFQSPKISFLEQF